MPKKRGKKYIEAAKKVEAAVASNGNGGLDTEALLTEAPVAVDPSPKSQL